MHLIRALRDCKQRSLTVSKKAPTVSKKASPHFLRLFQATRKIKITFWVGIPWTSKRSISGLQPEMGTKMTEKWILALPEKWGENGPENEKNGPENGKNGAQNGLKIFGPFSPFSGPCFSPFSGKAKIHFSAIFVPISGRRPEMDQNEVHGIPTFEVKRIARKDS